MQKTLESIEKAQYILNVMQKLRADPGDIVSSRYNIQEVLAELGISMDGKSLDQIYNELNFMVQMELWGERSFE